jgi:hypothetical protein
MNMMKKMYDEGDDQMKKVSAHAVAVYLFTPACQPLDARRPSVKPCSSPAWEVVLAVQEAWEAWAICNWSHQRHVLLAVPECRVRTSKHADHCCRFCSQRIHYASCQQ